ncbi:hypothetical protein NKW53_12020 [Acetobacter orientalis]|uniref:hypothetical protein n=1 Tax=Acetobacter orientalis TaxID=146474 RepID=UPI00209D9071|nr:hypothetical protein [Acetobacter orientalis]MCP1216792.1 hypothetical protein [Acetobacter orientalis]MCP1219519.1 hypothetical protein [Acetobacter orientalis]
MANASIKIDTRAIQKQLSDMAKQIPFATATALNSIAFDVMRKENDSMAEIFDNPRPFTQRATQVEKKASKTDLTAVVSLRPAQERYLLPYEEGGQHATSGNAGKLLVPVDGPVDRYGQIPKGMIARLMQRPDVFAGTIKGIEGIWQRPASGNQRNGGKGVKGRLSTLGTKKTGLRLLYAWRENKSVNKSLGFVDRARKIIEASSPQALQAAIQKAIRTAR